MFKVTKFTYSYDEEAVLTAGDGDIGKIFHYINGKFEYHQRVYKYDNKP
jgi:type I restriction enzyme S subunit